jgi:GNAT superfamily N-acetyltransferase
MNPTMRLYRDEDDYWRIRAFLRKVFLLNGRREQSWHVSRLDLWRWHGALNGTGWNTIADVTFIWEVADGEIVAVLNPEDPGEVYLHVHPAQRTAELEAEMLAVAEAQLVADRDGRRQLAVWADDQDLLRQSILKRRGYARGKWVESQWRRDLDTPFADAPIPPGYTVRALGDVDELPARSWASWRGFHPDAPDEAYEGWEWYRNVQRCPLYRRDLDLVAVAPGGEIASFCTLWYDDATRSVCVEPVATVPAHRLRGLARATITEGLRRAQRMGATRAFVGGFAPGANALYASVLSPAHDRSEQWRKA